MRKLFLFFCISALVYAQTAENISTRLEEKLLAIESLQADFTQIYYASNMSTPLEETGRIFIKKPGWMKWEYQDPEEKIFLIKESLYQEYYPEENLLIQRIFSQEDRETDLLALLSGKRSILTNYTVELFSFPTENKNVHQIKLTPQEEEVDTYILLEIDNRTWLVLKAISFDWAGNRQEFLFSRIRTNINLSQDNFSLKLPPDVEIIK